MKKCVYAGVALVLAAAVTACGGGKGSSGGVASDVATGSAKPYAELRWGLVTWPGGYDSIKVPWSQAFSVESLVTQSLVESEPNGTVKRSGAIAASEQPNPTTFVYRLKPGVKFSDGKSLTAADVLYSLKRNLTGKEAWTKTYWEDVASVSSHDESTVVVKLKRPNAVWQDIMSFTSPILERARSESEGEKALGTAGHPLIGSGPWEVEGFTPEASVELSRNPYWRGPRQPAARIAITVFKSEATMALALRSGAIDGTFGYLTPKTFAGIPGVKQLVAPGVNLAMLQMNTTLPPFDDVHVRRAIAYATDVKGIIDALYPSGDAAEDVTISPSSLFDGVGSPSEVEATLSGLPRYEFDLAAARRELARSPYPHGFAMKIQALSNESSMVVVAQIVASDLTKIGIAAKVQEVPPDENADMFGSKVTVWANEYGAPYHDPEALMSSLLPPTQIKPPGTGLNDANYRNAEVNRLQAQELQALDPSARLKLIGRMLKIVGSDMPYRPLYTHGMLGALSEKYVFPTYSAWTILLHPWALDVKLAG